MNRRLLWAVRLLPAAALQAWFTPPRLSRRFLAAEAERLDGFDALTIPFRDRPLQAWSIGTGQLVLAVHGWGGRPAQLAPVARRLAAAGYRVVVLQIPGHARGEWATVRDSVAAVEAAVVDLGMPAAVVTHSYGAMVARLAFREAAPAAVVMFAPMLRVSQGVSRFAQVAKLAPWTGWRLRARLRRWSAELWPIVDDVNPEQLRGAEVLIVHDPADAETSFSLAAELAARRSLTMIDPVAGTGHNGVLVDDRALDRVATWLGQHVTVA